MQFNKRQKSIKIAEKEPSEGNILQISGFGMKNVNIKLE